MMDLNALVVFAKVAETNSFSEAARRLGIPVSTVSRRVAELEAQLGVRLLDRSTRSLRLTDLGSEVLEHALHSVESVEAIQNIISNQRSSVRGTLRLSAPPSISDTLLTPLVTAFQTSYPEVRVQILITERMVDHIADGVDIAFRLGALKDSSLVSVLGVGDITQIGKTYSAATFLFFETYTVVAFFYLVMTISLSLLVRRLERRLRPGGAG